jgi:small neutral amino acid transporter SnatA (MarC family)
MTETSIHILTRIMRMILTVIAVQFIVSGLKGFGLLALPATPGFLLD